MFVFVPGPPVHFTNNVLCMNCTSALRVSVEQLLQLNCLIITFDLFSCLIIHFWFNRIFIFLFFLLAQWSSEWHLRLQSSEWTLNVASLRHLHQKLLNKPGETETESFPTKFYSGEAGLGSWAEFNPQLCIMWRSSTCFCGNLSCRPSDFSNIGFVD